MKLQLIVAQGKHEGKTIPVSGPQFIIGRHRQCQLKAASSLIGKHHCALLIRGSKALVHDFDSVNGTFLNGERVQGEREIHNEDVLKVGPLVFLVWLEKGSAAAEKAKQAGESTIVRLLLGNDKSGGPEGVLDVSADSSYGSTIMHNPETPEKASKKKKALKKQQDVAASAETPTGAKAILEKYKRRSSS